MNAPFLPAGRRFAGSALLLLLSLLALLAPSPAARAAAWSEPPFFAYGKVLNLGAGTARQVYSGVLHLTLTTTSQPPQVVRASVDLRPIGPSFEYSYRVAIPQFVQPSTNELGTGFAVGALPVGVNIQAEYSVSSDSPLRVPVSVPDRAQLRKLFAGSSSRSAEFRVDLAVSFSETDSDGDGLPDWWEDAHGLNKFSAADAGQDPDQDGLSNLQEYRNGTNPRVANLNPLVQETLLSVPAGGRAGLALTVVDQDTSPTQIFLSYRPALPGLAWRLLGQPIAPGIEFTYQSVLNGEVTLEATPDFAGGLLQLRARDGVFGNTNAPGDDSATVAFNLEVNPISPLHGLTAQPLLWLDAGTAAARGPTVGEWQDRSSADHDAYQPSAPAQPLARDGQVRFEGGRFLYLDDRGLASPQFTAFLAFNPDSGGGSVQTIYRDPGFQLDVQTSAGLRHLQASQAGRTTLAPLARAGSPALYTLTAGPAATQVEAPDEGAALSSTNGNLLPPAFASLGAAYPLGALAPSNYFQGNLREVILFGLALPAVSRSLLLDYQLSRWEGFLVWDYRRAALPVRLAGRPDTRNSLHGGYGDDTLQGGPWGDLLRGGPGRNRCTGGGGPDRFAFDRTGSHDTITDFNAAEGDVLDLVDLMDATAGGTPPELALRPVTTRGSNNVPRVDTVVEIRYAGTNAALDQTITLQGVAYVPPTALRLPTVGTLPAPQIVDTTRPDVFVTAPTAGQIIRSETTTLTGRTRDNRGVALVYYSLNGGSWLNPITVNAWTNWNASLPLLPGTNTVLVFAVDAAGNRSLTNRLTFTSIQTAPLVQIIAGNGSVSPNYHQQSLEIGKAYTTTARAGAGYAFARWLDGAGTVLSENHELTFTMVRDLQLVAEFVPNPFPTLAGRYVGLYQATNGATLTTTNAGFATVRLTDTGSFNAQLQQGAQTWTFSGILSAGGKWSTPALPSAPQLAVSLQLDMTSAGVLSGLIAGPGGVLPLHAERAAYSTAKPAPQAGQYSLILPAAPTLVPAGLATPPPPSEPGGDGALAVHISAAGVVTVNGYLGDGTAVAQTTYVSQSGHWPLYGTPYNKKGVFLGWIQVRSGMQPALLEDSRWNLAGTVSWTKPGGTGSRLYPSGFSVMLGGVGQIFANRSPLLEWTTGTLVLEGGNLSGPITNSVTMGPGGRGTGPNGLSLAITTTGLKGSLLTGQVRDPATGRTVSFKGAVLQKQGTGHGFFLGTNQTGRVTLRGPTP